MILYMSSEFIFLKVNVLDILFFRNFLKSVLLCLSCSAKLGPTDPKYLLNSSTTISRFVILSPPFSNSKAFVICSCLLMISLRIFHV